MGLGAPNALWVEVTKPIPQDSTPQIKGLNNNDTFNTLDHAASGLAKDGAVSVSEVKGETLVDELVDDGGGATLWTHKGTEMEDAFAQDRSLPDPPRARDSRGHDRISASSSLRLV